MIRYYRDKDGQSFSAGEVVDIFIARHPDYWCSLSPNNRSYGQEATYRRLLNAYLLGEDIEDHVLVDPIVEKFDQWLTSYHIELEKI